MLLVFPHLVLVFWIRSALARRAAALWCSVRRVCTPGFLVGVGLGLAVMIFL
jgi:hypothetical protein